MYQTTFTFSFMFSFYLYTGGVTHEGLGLTLNHNVDIIVEVCFMYHFQKCLFFISFVNIRMRGLFNDLFLITSVTILPSYWGSIFSKSTLYFYLSRHKSNFSKYSVFLNYTFFLKLNLAVDYHSCHCLFTPVSCIQNLKPAIDVVLNSSTEWRSKLKWKCLSSMTR